MGSQGLCWLRADVNNLSQERAEMGEEVKGRPETSEAGSVCGAGRRWALVSMGDVTPVWTAESI